MHHADLRHATVATPVIQPWDYVAMRRHAAGLTIDQLAAALGGKLFARHLRAIETPGLRFRQIAPLEQVMAFNAAVYRQLADLPPHQHPRLCQRCGWDAHTDQPDGGDGLTTWSHVDDAICTRCAQAAGQ
ncbi:hypothetical protein [Sphingobium yanoikuyae]|uniref:Uncharacterized protein n=1 Tax=Sphingobium yanoikuyae TaxID=13690 RepID=A0A291MWG6_SPHYA|nr:hypothetical protein [Sphingobium yanoikuyae]ATI79436.1 hypothetical protein A6768_04955 [Sphingobium yanoikuyae]